MLEMLKKAFHKGLEGGLWRSDLATPLLANTCRTIERGFLGELPDEVSDGFNIGTQERPNYRTYMGTSPLENVHSRLRKVIQPGEGADLADIGLHDFIYRSNQDTERTNLQHSLLHSYEPELFN